MKVPLLFGSLRKSVHNKPFTLRLTSGLPIFYPRYWKSPPRQVNFPFACPERRSHTSFYIFWGGDDDYVVLRQAVRRTFFKDSTAAAATF